MSDSTADIALFLRVLDHGSISAAARSLDLSVAVASQRLKRLESTQGETQRDAAVQGLGFAMHSTWHVWPDLRAGRLVTVLDKYEAPPTAIQAVMPQRRHVPPRVRAVVDFVAERLGDPPPWER